MEIEVRLFATLRDGRFQKAHIAVADGTTLQKLVAQLKLPQAEVALMLVNGQHARWEKILEPNDVVSLFPPVGGG